MAYKLVMFDFDGTLCDSLAWFTASINRVADRFDFRRVPPEEIETLRGMEASQITLRVGLPRWKLPAVAAYVRTLMSQERHAFRLFDGAVSALQRLRAAGCQTAILTSNSLENVTHILGREGMQHVSYFECGVSLLGKGAKFRRLLKITGLPIQDVVYIGDELRDAEAARSAGVRFIAVSWGYTRAEALTAASDGPVLRSFDDLVERVLA